MCHMGLRRRLRVVSNMIFCGPKCKGVSGGGRLVSTCSRGLVICSMLRLGSWLLFMKVCDNDMFRYV